MLAEDEKLGDLPRRPLSELSELELLTWIRCRSNIEGGDYELCQVLEDKEWKYASGEFGKRLILEAMVKKYGGSDSDNRRS